MLFNRTEYPRPQFRRDQWQSLNGEWEFELDYEFNGEKRLLPGGKVALQGKINVPFTYNYPASGLKDVKPCDTMWYRRVFDVKKNHGERVLLCFNAADYFTDVWVNGKHVYSHSGGYTPFTADITNFVKNGENVAVVKCVDPDFPELPRGKQTWTGSRFGCWYVPNSGIWQSVWIEYCGADYISSFSVTPDIDKACFFGEIDTAYGIADSLEISVLFGGKTVKKQSVTLDGTHTHYTVCLAEPDFVGEVHYWSIEHPNLYQVELTLKKGDSVCDVAHTRFGMRKIHVNEFGQICLNNRPLYQRLILDQGYWKQSGITPPSAEALKQDIQLAQQMGFNGARKHQKFEDPYFYYYADELGFLVWCEMPSAYSFCPTEIFEQTKEWQGIVSVAKNFASVIGYVPLNESWGVRKILLDSAQQNYARALYYLTKSLDGTRLISTNDGWENLDSTDVVTIHDYAFDSTEFASKYVNADYDALFPTGRKLMADGCQYFGQPILFSEFGGIALKNDATDGNWGYNSGAADCNELLARAKNLVDGIYTCPFQGFCYTQLTDVQQEVNGLLDEDHNPKADLAALNKIFGKRK